MTAAIVRRRSRSKPRIVRTAGVCGGRPRIDGTRVGPEVVYHFYALGWGPVKIQRAAYPSLSIEQIEAAIRFERWRPWRRWWRRVAG